MNPQILVTVGDTPQIVLSLRDETTGDPIDLSPATVSVVLRVRPIDPAAAVSTVTCSKLPGLQSVNGDVDTTPPYDVAGKGGRCLASCAASVFPTPGEYRGEAKVSFADSGRVASVYRLIKISARKEL